MQKTNTFTAPATSPSYPVDPEKLLTFRGKGDQDDWTGELQIKITDDGPWATAQVLEDGTPYSSNSGARHVRFFVSDMGTAASVVTEISA